MTSKSDQPTNKNSGKKPEVTDEKDNGDENTSAFNLNNLLDDPESFARNASEAMNEIGNVAAAIMKPIEQRGSELDTSCLLYTSPSPRDLSTSRMPSSA